MSHLNTKVVSVSSDVLIGCPNFPTTSNSLFSLYKPTVVTYGLKSELVAKSAISPESLDLIFLADIFVVSLNSCSSTVH